MKVLEPANARHDFLIVQGVFICILQALAASVVPALEYLWVFNGSDFRWSVEQYVHWGVATVPAVLGIIALASKSQAWLALHIAVGAMFGAALAADNVSAFNTLDTRCLLAQAAYSSCATCACAASSSCTQAQLSAPACQLCAAPSLDLCTAFSSNRIVVAVAGAVTVVTMAAPVALSLLLLARLVAQHAMQWAQLAAARLRTLERLELLGQGLAPSLPQGDIKLLERSRTADLQALALQLQTALVKAGYTEAAGVLEGPGNDSKGVRDLETDAAASVHSAAHAPLVTAVTVVPTHISTLQSGNLEAPLLSIDVPGRLEQPLGVSELMLPEAASDEKKKRRKKKKVVEQAVDEASPYSAEPQDSPDSRV